MSCTKEKIISSFKEIENFPLEFILPAFLSVVDTKKKEITETQKDILEIKHILYNLFSDSSVENGRKTTVKKLSAEEFREAFDLASKLYFEDGLDLSDIKIELMNKFNLNDYLAQDLLQKGIQHSK